MAQFIRGKQSGIQGDLSAGIHPDVFILDDVSMLLLELSAIPGLEMQEF